jgi:hypothetical protein
MSYKSSCCLFGEVDDRQVGFPIAAVFRSVQMKIGAKVDAYLIRVMTRVWIDHVVMDFRSVDNLVTRFSKGQVFFKFFLRPIWKELLLSEL